MAYPNQLVNGRGHLIDAVALMANFNAAVQKAGDTMTGDLNISAAGKGLVLTTPDGAHTYRIAISNAGELTTEQIT